MPGPWELILIFATLILIFGGKKLPGLGSAIGESIRNFKKGLKPPKKDQLDELTEKSITKRKLSDFDE